jgi:hypothetical protein
MISVFFFFFFFFYHRFFLIPFAFGRLSFGTVSEQEGLPHPDSRIRNSSLIRHPSDC